MRYFEEAKEAQYSLIQHKTFVIFIMAHQKHQQFCIIHAAYSKYINLLVFVEGEWEVI